MVYLYDYWCLVSIPKEIVSIQKYLIALLFAKLTRTKKGGNIDTNNSITYVYLFFGTHFVFCFLNMIMFLLLGWWWRRFAHHEFQGTQKKVIKTSYSKIVIYITFFDDFSTSVPFFVDTIVLWNSFCFCLFVYMIMLLPLGWTLTGICTSRISR